MVQTRRQQIEDAASELFRDRGYAATSVRDIARAIDMQGASLYAHVASKEDVLWSIVTRAADRFDAATEPIAADTSAPASDRLAALIRAHVEVVTSDLANASSFLHEWRFLSAARRAEILRRRDAYEARFRDAIRDGVRSGQYAVNTDPRLAAILILGALNGVGTWYQPSGSMTPDEIGDHYATLLLHGLTRGASRPRTDP